MELFTQWFLHFLMYTNPTKESIVGHTTRMKNLDFINLARDNYVTVLCLPPHCTHRLQHDLALMSPY